MEVGTAAVRIENQLAFGGPWLALEIIRKLKLHDFFQRTIPRGKEDIPWSLMAQVLVVCRLCNPSSELHIAGHYYRSTAMNELLGVPTEKVYDERLYRALDAWGQKTEPAPKLVDILGLIAPWQQILGRHGLVAATDAGRH